MAESVHLFRALRAMSYHQNGFDVEDNGYQAPAHDGSGVEVVVKADSNRLQHTYLLSKRGTVANITRMLSCLIKAEVNALPTISLWLGLGLRFRGHLDNISNNCLIGAVNAFGGATNSKVVNQLDGSKDESA